MIDFQKQIQNKRSMSVSRSLSNMEKEKNIKEMPQNMICGRNPVIEALKSGANLDTVYIDGNGGSLSVIRRLAKENGVVVKDADDKKLSRLSGGASHQGVVAEGACGEYVTVEDILAVSQKKGTKPFIINQNKYNIFDRTIENNGLKKNAPAEGKGIITFSPLAQGLLTDRYLNGIPEDSRIGKNTPFLRKEALTESIISKINGLNKIAESRGQTLAQMALSWILKDDAITSVLIGASKPSQITDCIKCIEKTSFTAEELKQIDRLSK